MEIHKRKAVSTERIEIASVWLERAVFIDAYLPQIITEPNGLSLLLINDGQDLERISFSDILEDLYDQDRIRPLLCLGIHAGSERKMEYGTAGVPDFRGRGAKAQQYTRFIFDELIPQIRKKYHVPEFREKSFAGFSLGALSALDIVWNHPQEFLKVGVFSGSLWWRCRDKHDPEYRDDQDRIMQQAVRHGSYFPWLKFFFECGAGDEGEDRNKNGVIDSIDDTLDLIEELKAKGWRDHEDICFMLIEDGKHDLPTWARAWPEFLQWGWSKSNACICRKSA
ncbi:MAG: alpha/beta hydrolase [Chitinophagales bacterium]